MTDLLIHSLSEFKEIIEGVLEAARPAHIVEVGAEAGRTTTMLHEWARAHAARLTTVDPAPVDAVRALAASAPQTHALVTARSPAALDGLAAAQLYLLDGDHNYWSVSGELARLHATTAAAGVLPVVIAHDVGWPCARRDQYYDPESVPAEARHPHSYDVSLHVDSPDPVPAGFSGGGVFAIALESGGPKNGVLTAVEQFVAEHGWELHIVSAVFGLGVLFPPAHAAADAMRSVLSRYAGNPLLERLDENRLRNWLEVRRLQESEKALIADRDGLRAELASSRDALARERDEAARRDAELAARIAALETAQADAARRIEELEARWYTRAGRWLDRRTRPMRRS